MKFWDSSAVLPLVVRQANSTTVAGLLREDVEVAVWWGTWVECAVALSRLAREGALNEEAGEEARSRLDLLSGNRSETRPNDDVRLLASIISKDHRLKAADALQLAAALRWCEGDTEGQGFVCLDDRLRRAAREEGFLALPEQPEKEAEYL